MGKKIRPPKNHAATVDTTMRLTVTRRAIV
jgi:hypothetical protein